MEFRCEKCGKLLNVDSDPGSMIRCPHCNKKIVVPAALAAMPHPQMPATSVVKDTPANQPAAGQTEGQGEGQEGEEEEEEEGEDVLVGAMAKIMPWVISIFFHVGLFLIMAFVTMIVKVTAVPDDVIVPDAVWSDNPGGVLNPGSSNPNAPMQQQVKKTDQNAYSKREAAIQADTGKTDKKPMLIGMSAGESSGGGLAAFGLSTGGQGSGPRSSFFGSGGGNVHHIVYVIDRSGSMIDTFQFVRAEMLISISRLRPMQDFHVILFAEGHPKEMEHRRLVPAIDRYKESAAMFLEPIRAEGRTDPVPALERAFDVLAQADPRRPGKLVYLLTDGVFPDNAKVVACTSKRNGTGKDHVFINTYLYGNKPPEAEKVMIDIAKQSGGKYKYVSADE
ncbi:MAG: DNA-directed RNA polymerase subunit P [Planctomycetes bacterium ADurb.Bin126]|nr:MAG: DNA-directed RNA polymerase subunit P [Planctomycetes bacterium ADurb.Bin126]